MSNLGSIKSNQTNLAPTVPAEFTSSVGLGLMATRYVMSFMSFTVEMSVVMAERLVTDDLNRSKAH
jgi:hypothetical protein